MIRSSHCGVSGFIKQQALMGESGGGGGRLAGVWIQDLSGERGHSHSEVILDRPV